MRECEIELDDLTVRGKRWGSIGGKPVIALHGWLDNCASFDFLAPLLPELDLLALDLAGQGKSDHREHGGSYNIWLDIREIIAVANQLNWCEFGLIGHSRGAMISTMIAGTFPERVSHLALVESFAPQILDPHEAPHQMAAAINSLLAMRGKERSVFDSFDAAVTAREKGFLKLDHQDALVLAKRGVAEKGGKFFWNNDIKLNAPSEVKFTAEQVRAFADRIHNPVELVIANDGLVHEFPIMKEFIEQTPNIRITRLPGEHHLHMSHQCQAVAKIFNAYFQS